MTKDQIRAQADWFAAFGEPTRLTIIRDLAVGVKTVTDLATLLKVELVNVFHHLKVLKAAGVVTAERDGRFRRCSLVGAKTTARAIEMTHKSGARIVLPLN